MAILGIETSCDETAAAVVENGKILSSVVSSSVPLHEKYGGVIPEIASRFHIEYINKVAKKALKKARKNFRDLDGVAVTDEPGLPGAGPERSIQCVSAFFALRYWTDLLYLTPAGAERYYPRRAC